MAYCIVTIRQKGLMMNKLVSVSLLATLMCSCTVVTPRSLTPISSPIKDSAMQVNSALTLTTYQQKPLIKNVNDYAKWLIQDLFSNLDSPDNSYVFAIANFALLDSNLKTTNHFGRQLHESIMHETNRTGFSVIDLKSTGRLQFTDAGDIFWHSEKIDEVSGNLDINFVITGTMTKHQGGYLLNARIIDVDSNALMSSSQILIPANVVDAVLTEETQKPKGFPIISSVK
jgi:TolB-like protein